jgi:cellulose synthase/poly-beta-1,6-N-acetylglucosamine synthase-like glycosyltransferase
VFTFSIVVVDNDRLQSGEEVASNFSKAGGISLTYCVEPEQNIALARNRAVGNAGGDFIAFIDDDEFPPDNWLITLFNACQKYEADVVLGPVRPFFEGTPPQWLVAGGFCDRLEHKTGMFIHWKEARTGNVLLKRSILKGVDEVFRREFGSGSEDTDFFRRMSKQGFGFVWCNEAPVLESVPPSRWKRRYLLKRALLRGQNQRQVAGFQSVLKSIIAVPIYAVLLPFLLLIGQHVFMKSMVKLCDHLGKILAFIGFRPMGEKYING